MIQKIFFQTSKKPPHKFLIYLIKKRLGPDWKYLHFDDIQMVEFIEKINLLSQKYHSLTKEDEESLEMIFKKYI